VDLFVQTCFCFCLTKDILLTRGFLKNAINSYYNNFA
jgi:hypothetical protein